jgi:hypothetical protein
MWCNPIVLENSMIIQNGISDIKAHSFTAMSQQPTSTSTTKHTLASGRRHTVMRRDSDGSSAFIVSGPCDLRKAPGSSGDSYRLGVLERGLDLGRADKDSTDNRARLLFCSRSKCSASVSRSVLVGVWTESERRNIATDRPAAFGIDCGISAMVETAPLVM